MQYKVGDEVLIKGRILVVDHTDRDYPYEVRIDEKSIENLWISEDMIAESKTYAQGLADAWELAKKILNMKIDVAVEVFDCTRLFDVMDKFNPEEALAKLESYEKEKEIKVGDVVSFEDETKALVVDEALEKAVFVFTENGCVEKWDRTLLKKTGKHIDIESLLKQIGE